MSKVGEKPSQLVHGSACVGDVRATGGSHELVIMFIAKEAARRALAEPLQNWAGTCTLSRDLASGLAQVRRGSAAWTHLVIDIDGLGELEDILATLHRFRLDRCDVPVILLSAGFGVDDFGTHRLSITDVSLRVPTAARRFKSALIEARHNNRTWQHRCRSLAH
jgi:hypothetical protein